MRNVGLWDLNLQALRNKVLGSSSSNSEDDEDDEVDLEAKDEAYLERLQELRDEEWQVEEKLAIQSCRLARMRSDNGKANFTPT